MKSSSSEEHFKKIVDRRTMLLKGLEVKVDFNGIQKEALTELSCGQRFLVA
jgi:hypothetical protein